MSTLRLATWAVRLTPSSVPAPVLRHALLSLYNYTGCAIGGSNHATVSKAHRALSPLFGPATSSLFAASKEKVDAQHAALLNGIASHVHDYDDTHLETIIHPTGPVASALYAVVEYLSAKEGRVVSGQEFLTALVAGIEAECKVGLAVWPNHYDVGWHITSSTGGIGAAVAVGKILGLDEEKMANAIGVAAAQVTGLREMFGSDTKSFHVGRSSQNGLLASLLAKEGFTSSTVALEAKRGFVKVVGQGVDKLDEQVGTLGDVWETGKNSFKPFPCGIVIHPIIDACVQLGREIKEKLGADGIKQVKGVHARVHPLVLELTGKKEPKDELQAKFSVYHGGAVGLLFGKATPAQYEDHIVTDKDVISVRDSIQATADQSLTADEAYITVLLQDGSKLEKHVEHAVGSVEVPMTEQLLQEKFLDQVTPVLGAEKAKAASDAVWKLADASDMAKAASELYI